ncbi:purine/pyrimidine permease [Corynebacterium sp. 153RC1]|uniref:solute carrier family 23 protein n=1 Tax=unclassified Corynebacterium TaxID=2624378 RepID=UPI00211BBBF2|nr:purine/pyrimidine permease [Corynebacterium sp. 209RC1]MCQ9355257.1 purine/pyrimidine permease [Corynebacterium sp. 1222RC1]MCQ9357569.1 purine/pyrimidine permease [Corynebacterium sp. 122RC1]MCQ9359146.1 purine/pyrimidine permease [Corynebacterium sp. 142RC1]MCQ9361814.1 purine/pyrimidine permease [Corynebacterium sp. 153RC1]MCQ9364065.1 purine/pyrimidine permease [Corynebacterium sp. 732RC1]MCQ9366033.1 purine/pyrimidine permease [Corynebacterium sp. 70RC1]MCQ9371537.1 purine/pyrimidine
MSQPLATTPASPANPATTVHPVDAVPPAPQLAALGLQHVLAFYAGAVIVPLLIAGSLNLDTETTIHLINADLLTCGIATLIQAVGIGKKVGVRLPIIQGVTTTSVAPIIAIGLSTTDGQGGVESLPTIYGAVIVAGLFTFFVAPLFGRLLRFFPPVVTGTVLLVMGTSLLAVSANDFVNYAEEVPATHDLWYAFGTLAVIILVQRFFSGFLGTLSILIGLLVGTTAAILFGHANLDAVGEAAPLGITTPFYFGTPQFNVAAILSLVIVMIITMVETTGDVFATGEIVKKRIRRDDVERAIRADGLSTLIGGVMNSFPYTCFAQNVGLVRLTGVKSRWVAVAAAGFMIVLGLLPKAGAIVASIPAPVLGAASLALFANVAWVGLQTIAKTDLMDGRNAVIVTTALGLAMLVTFRPDVAQALPQWAQIFVSSGMSIGAIAAIVLNLLFFHLGSQSGKDVARGRSGEGISLEELNAMDVQGFVSALRPLFNNETWPLEQAAQARPFGSVEKLREAIQVAVLTAEPQRREALIQDYPDTARLLLATAEEAPALSAERGTVGIDELDDVQSAQIQEISAQYQARFNMPFVACLSTTDTVDSVVARGLRRLANSDEQEHRVALTEIVEIANDRFDILLANANPIRSAWERKFSE